MRTPTAPDTLEAQLGPRGSLTCTKYESDKIALLKRWLCGKGAPSQYANRAPYWLALKCYNDTTDASLVGYVQNGKDWLAAKEAATVTPAPVAPAPVAPAPVTPAPVTPAPVTPAPVSLESTLKIADGKISTKSWDALLVSLKQNGTIPNVVNRVLLYGPPRTGKSTGASQIFGGERFTCHKQQPIDDWLGGYTLKDGTTVWVDGPVIRAMRNGTPVVMDEIDQMSPETRFTFHAIGDDPGGVTLATGERVTAKPGFMIVATTNAQPGTLPPPVLDRFDIVLYCDKLAHGLKTKLGALADAAQRSVATAVTKHWLRPASPNMYLAAAKLLAAGMSQEDVANVLYSDNKTARADLLALLATVK